MNKLKKIEKILKKNHMDHVDVFTEKEIVGLTLVDFEDIKTLVEIINDKFDTCVFDYSVKFCKNGKIKITITFSESAFGLYLTTTLKNLENHLFDDLLYL